MICDLYFLAVGEIMFVCNHVYLKVLYPIQRLTAAPREARRVRVCVYFVLAD